MKRLLTLVATLVWTLAMPGCDSGNGSNNQPDQTTADQTPEDTAGQDVTTDGTVPDLLSDQLQTDLAADQVPDQLPTDSQEIDQNTPQVCPATYEEANGATCSEIGQECSYGEECCCGTCFPSIRCTCMGTTYGCAYTEACMPPSCEDYCCDPADENACTYWAGEEVPFQCLKFDGWDSGHCLPPVEYPYCWADQQCGVGQVCKNPDFCSCTELCDMWQVAGVCEYSEPPEGCCQTDEQCDQGINMAFQCGFLPGEEWGTCLPLANGTDECWDQSDCAEGMVCEGATFCPCGSLCGQIQAPGHCKARPAGLPCMQDSQCTAGEVCVGSTQCLGDYNCTPVKGKCQPATSTDLCWSDSGCTGTNDVCIAATYCLGGGVCLIDEHPGVCLPQAITGCWWDQECPQPDGVGHAVCTGEWVIPWWTGIDYDADPDHEGECCVVTEGQCYEDSQCHEGQACHGAIYNALGDCEAGNAVPGTCMDDTTWPEELCLSDLDCDAGQACTGAWTCPPGARCIEPVYPGLCLTVPTQEGSCYTDQGCSSGTTCTGSWVCDVVGGEMCGGLMASPGTCQPLPLGNVGDPCGLYGGACQAGLACCYPCGIPGCIDQCTVPCDPSEPWCFEGCGMMP